MVPGIKLEPLGTRSRRANSSNAKKDGYLPKFCSTSKYQLHATTNDLVIRHFLTALATVFHVGKMVMCSEAGVNVLKVTEQFKIRQQYTIP